MNGIYGAFPAWPLDAVQPSALLPPLPLPAYAAEYAAHFEASFDYEAHGAMLGLEYPEALRYFLELAHLRDATMAHHLSGKTFAVFGEWHVKHGLAVPARVTTPHKIVTTATSTDNLAGVADYVLVYR